MNYISHIIIAVIVILGFVLFMPSEPTAYYYSSLAYSLILVILRACSAYYHRQITEGHTSQFAVTVAMNTTMYVVCGVLWTLFCAFLGIYIETGTQMRIFVMGILIYSLIYYLFVTYISKRDRGHASFQEMVESNTEEIRQLAMKIEQMAEQSRTPANSQAWDDLIRSVKSYPPSLYNERFAELTKTHAELLKRQ